MANSFTGRSAVSGHEAGAAAGGLATAEIGAALQAIAEHLLDLDRRQSDAMDAMQGRLAELCNRTFALRNEIPPEFASAFDRIQDGVHLLAERLASRAAQSQCAPSERAEAPVPAPPPYGHEETAARPVQPPVHEPAPAPLALRSAMPTASHGDDAGHADGRTGARTPPIDPFDFMDEVAAPVDASHGWDRASADALTKAYEGADPDLLPRGEAAAATAETTARSAFTGRRPEQQTSTAAMLSASMAEPVGEALPSVERAWLEARFAEIAARLEQSIAEVRPESTVVALGERFDLLEERLGAALQDVATRADVEGLRLVEAHINELASQIEQAQSQLARLEVIETQLGQLSHDLSSRIAAGELGSGQLSAENIELVARSVAEETAHRVGQLLPAAQIAGAGNDQIASLQTMMQAYSEERRQGEQQHAAVLDTMQQALLQLLDRVEEIDKRQEVSQIARRAASASPSELRAEAGRPTGDAPEAPATVPQLRDSGTARAAATAAAAAAAAASRMGGTADRWSDLRVPPADDAPRPAKSDDDRMGARPRREQPAPQAAAPGDVGREDFLLAARRQMQASPAAKSALTDAPAEKVAATGLNGMIAKLTRRGASEPAVAPAIAKAEKAARPVSIAGKGTGGSTTAKPYLLVAIIAMLIAGGLFMTVRPMSGALDATGRGDRKLSTQKTSGVPGIQAPKPAAKTSDEGERQPQPSSNAPDAPSTGTEGQATPPSVPDKTGMDSGAGRGATTVGGYVPASTQAASLGIALSDRKAGGSPAEEIMRARRQQDTAALSERIGHAAAQIHGGSRNDDGTQARQGAATAGTAAGVTQAALQDPATGDGAKPVEGKTVSEMPPLNIGPSSLRAAAANGDPSAEFDVAARFAQGKGVKQDFEQAAKWYQRAATRGFAPAQYRIGTLFERGLGVKADLARARVWYLRAAEQGNVRAMHNLAVLSAGRQASAPDYTTASHWFGEAAAHGLADSQFNLAVLYEHGLGVPKDPAEALKWYTLASRGGDKEAARRTSDQRARLTAETLETVDRMVAEWEARPIDKLVNDAYAAGEAWKSRSAGNVAR